MKKVVCFRQGTFLLIYRKGRETMKTDNKKTIRGPEILESIGVGLWMIRTNKETGYSEMYADKVLQKILGIEKELSPGDFYSYWFCRVTDSYYNYINNNLNFVIQDNRVIQLEYVWEHPKKGNITIRCIVAKAEDDENHVRVQGLFIPSGEKVEYFR